MKKKKMMLILVLLLAIGFASVSTTLIITGVVGVSSKQEDFNVIFTNAKLDGVERKDFIDESDKQLLNFETNKLTSLDEPTSIVEYEVTNTSRNYDAEVTITCNLVNESEEVITSEYVTMDYSPKSMTVVAGTSETGRITATLKKTSTIDQNIKVKCTLDAKPLERTSLGAEYVNRRSGVLMAYSEGNKIWSDEIRNNTTNIIFENTVNPHATSEELIFDMSEAQDGSIMAYAVNNSNSTGYDLYIQAKDKIIANENSSYLFHNFSNLKSIEGLYYFDTKNVTNTSHMFNGCRNLINLDLNFGATDLRNVEDMSYMFSDCTNLTYLGLINIDINNISNVENMFRNMPSNANIVVGWYEEIDWVLTSDNGRPTEWSTSNVQTGE